MKASSDDARDAPRSPLRMLMLPEPQHDPPRGRQAGIRVAVPPDVPEDLLLPPRGVRPRPRRVDRARVPEAAIDEHDDLRADECEVGPPSGARQRPVDAVAQAEPVDGRTNGELAECVARGCRQHPVSNVRRRCWRALRFRAPRPRRRSHGRCGGRRSRSNGGRSRGRASAASTRARWSRATASSSAGTASTCSGMLAEGETKTLDLKNMAGASTIPTDITGSSSVWIPRLPSDVNDDGSCALVHTTGPPGGR
jgi:hypothetical protein